MVMGEIGSVALGSQKQRFTPRFAVNLEESEQLTCGGPSARRFVRLLLPSSNFILRDEVPEELSRDKRFGTVRSNNKTQPFRQLCIN